MKIWGIQYNTTDLYEHIPVDVLTFINDKDYLDAGGECWPEIKSRLVRIFNQPPTSLRMSTYDEFVFEAGIGSGKSYLISILFSYLVYRLLCLRNPQHAYGLAKGEKIALINMSKNAKIAKKVVFDSIAARVKYSPWFNQFGLPDPDVQSELRFPKGIIVMPGNSEETSNLGFNIFAANIDEAAFFKTTNGHDTAFEIFHACKSRMTSRFRKPGILGIISSPRYVDDFIEKKIKESEGAPHILSERIETWNSNPKDLADIEKGDFFESIHPLTKERVKIPLRYQYDFARNPEKAWRDFGAVPSMALEPYIRQYNLIKRCVDTDLYDPFTGDYLLMPEWRGNTDYEYFIHIDLAIKRDAAGFAMAHMDENEIVIVDIIHRIEAKPNMDIDITAIKDLVIEFQNRGCFLGKVTYDQFQSAQSIQELTKAGIESENLSVDRTMGPYETLKERCYTDAIRFPNHEIFLEEMQRLELIEGKKVDHPAKGSKDCADAVAGAVYNTVKSDETGEGELTIV